MSAISSFTSIEKKHDLYRGKDCMKTLSESLREHAMKIILKRKKNEIINKGQQKSNGNPKTYYIC